MPEILLVAEARHRDAGRGIARIDSGVMKKLGLVSGDIVEIKGKAPAYAIVWPGYPEDAGRGIIRIDGNIRSNASIGIGERVEVAKAIAEKAKRIGVAPTEPIRIVRGSEYIRKVLEGQPVIKDQQIRVDILGRALTFIVTSTQPTGVVIVAPETEVMLVEKPIEALRTYVTYEDIGGLKREVGLIREMVELPLKHPELFQRLGIEPPKGVLLHGPPGTGKTLIAKAVANETDANFVFLSGPEVIGKYYGESEARLREIFEQAEANPPAIILIDEIDAIAPKRSEMTGERMVERRVVAQLLALMDGLKTRGKVVVIGATNQPGLLDEALRRGGRFDREIEIGIPDRNGRHEILQIHTRGMPLAENVDLNYFADITHGFVGADLAGLCLTPDSIVFTTSPTEISRCNNCDKVLSSNGGYSKVLSCFKRDYSGDVYKIKPYYMPHVSLTPEHPVLVVRGHPQHRWKMKKYMKKHSSAEFSTDAKWVKAGEVRKGDYLLFPKIKHSTSYTINLKKYAGNFSISKGPCIQLKYDNKKRPLPQRIKSTPELFELIGWYIAEGHCEKNSVKFGLGFQETKYAKRIKYLIEKVFNVHAAIYNNTAGAINVATHSRVLVNFFKDNFGGNAISKQLPSWLIDSPPEYLEIFFNAYWKGDGYRTKDGRAIYIGTASKTLALQLYLVLNKMGIFPCWSAQKQGKKSYGKKKRMYYRLFISRNQARKINIHMPPSKGTKNVLIYQDSNFFYLPVKSIYKIAYNGPVYNLETENSTYVSSFIVHNCKEAAMSALRKVLPKIEIEKEIPAEILEALEVTGDDFSNAFKTVTPSAMREVFIETPNVHWDDIGGLEDAKQELREAVEWPLKYPEAFEHFKTKPPKGILLFGPPGTGKTMLAKAVATEGEANFISIKGPELLSKFVGESEKGVREMFRKARQAAPAIIFFDEVDAMCPTRTVSFDSHVSERVVSQMLTELDGLEELKDVLVVCASNRPDMIDRALLRPGRIDRLIYVPPPDAKEREEIFKVHLVGKPLAKDVSLSTLAKQTEGYVGADIAAICREAVMLSLREAIKPGMTKEAMRKALKDKQIERKHFEEAIKKVRQTMTPETLRQYEDIMREFMGYVEEREEREKPYA